MFAVFIRSTISAAFQPTFWLVYSPSESINGVLQRLVFRTTPDLPPVTLV